VAKLTRKQQVFINLYIQYWNATRAAQEAGYKHPAEQGYKLLKLPAIKEAISTRLKQSQIEGDEVLVRISQQATLNKADFYIFDWVQKIDSQNQPIPVLDTQGNPLIVDGHQVYEQSYEAVGVNWNTFEKYGHLVKGLRYDRKGRPIIEFHDAQAALLAMARFVGVESGNVSEIQPIVISADSIAPSFINAYRDVRDHRHTEYVFFGGRGSTKSSFISLVMIYLLVNNPDIHGFSMRQVANTLRNSVYSQLVWAIGELGLTKKFRCTTSPLEITYQPTGQKIYFYGNDDPNKIKSIKPPFGYIGLLWLEELDQFAGENEVRKIEQSVIRGGDLAYIFKSFNPPPTLNNWANKYIKVPKDTQYQHVSNYIDVPAEWLGKIFIEEAEFLKTINPKAYEHEYLGIPSSAGGLVFENVELRKITDEEISQFDHVLHGQDWGYFPDPAHYGRCHYDAARLTLYIFGEVRRWKMSNRELYDDLVRYGLLPDDLLICDSAEPKSVADFREYGASSRPAEKGPESVKYSMKWLQSLVKIVIDPERAPYSAEEFSNYEYEMDKDGNFISQYPDKNNHAIDSIRYACNLIWRRRGQ